MNSELLLLSGQIALLVLVASVLSALIVWSWCRLGLRAAHSTAAEHEQKTMAAEQAAETARTAHAAAEQQCFTAMEQRDEAERQALERSAEARRLADQLANLQLNSITRDEHQQLLTEATQRLHDLETGDAARLDELRAAISRLEAEHTQAIEQRDAMAVKLEVTTQQQASALAELAQTHASEIQTWQTKLDAATAEAQCLQLALQNADAIKQGIEHDLRARIAELESRPSPAPVAPPPEHIAPALVKSPAIKPVPAAAAPVIEGDEPFPMAPLAPVLATALQHRLIKGTPAETTAPNLDAARAQIASMESAKEEVLQRLASAQAEVAQLASALEQQLTTEPSATEKHKPAQRHLKEAQQRATHSADEHARLQRHIRALTRSLATLEGHDLKADDLTQLKGVKTVLNQQLHSLGIYTYRQIVAWDAEDILAFGELLSFKQRITRDKWQEQARQLHEAHYGERLI